MWVRTAGKSDLKAIRELLVSTWHATYDDIYGAEKVTEITETWHSQAALEKQLATPNSEFLVADDGKNTGGIAYAAMESDGKCKLHQLYVAPELQGRGLGRDLLNEIETCFPQASSMVLEVEPENKGAIGFYEKAGYTKTGETDDCGKVGSGIKAHIFEKPLAGWEL